MSEPIHPEVVVTDPTALELLVAENQELRDRLAICAGLMVNSTVAYMAEVEEKEELITAATTDDLTKLLRRNAFAERVTKILDEKPPKSNKRTYAPDYFSIIFIDIDHFKPINDAHGHSEGDNVICKVAKSVQLRNEDLAACARYGGEEFAIMLPWTSYEGGLVVAERLREEIEANVLLPSGKPVTASFGVAYGQINEVPFGGLDKTIALADTALFHAKQEGRNRVAYANPHGIKGLYMPQGIASV